MNDDDLYGPKLTPPPQTSPIVRGAAIAVVTVSLAVGGCSSNPGTALLVDTGIYYTPDSGPDAGPDAAAPGVDAGPDAANPGLGVVDAGTDTGP